MKKDIAFFTIAFLCLFFAANNYFFLLKDTTYFYYDMLDNYQISNTVYEAAMQNPMSIIEYAFWKIDKL